MVSGRSELRGLGRHNSTVDAGVKPARAEIADQNSRTPDGGGGFAAARAVQRTPVTVLRQPRLPLAPLQRATLYDQRNIVEFLTLKEAIALMQASSDLHHLIHADPWFDPHDLLDSLHKLGPGQMVHRMQTLEAEIARLQLQAPRAASLPPADPSLRVHSSTFVAGALPEAVVLGVLFAHYCHNLLLARSATKAAQADERSRQAEVRCKEAQLEQIATGLQALEPQIERLVFHHVSERMERPRLGHELAATALTRSASASSQAAEGMEDIRGRLNQAIQNADVSRARLMVRTFLSLPADVMPATRKLHRLVLQPDGPLEYFSQHCHGFLGQERTRHDAIMGCVDEIVSCGALAATEQMKLRAKLAEICADALDNSNPAAAASVLLGVCESSAPTAFKLAFLAVIGGSGRGTSASVIDTVSTQLLRYRHGAPGWVDDVIARLHDVRQGLPPFDDGTLAEQLVT
ncbi:hypothetical protein BH11PSE7_BH11PSE7_37770 [soil metagenome]